MEIGSIPRTPVLPPSAEPSRAVNSPPASVRTELPRDAAVQQTEDVDAVEPGPKSRPAPTGDFLDRTLSVDIETRKIVFKAIDERTGEVVSQIPDPRYLQAYRDQLRAAADPEEVASPLAERLA